MDTDTRKDCCNSRGNLGALDECEASPTLKSLQSHIRLLQLLQYVSSWCKERQGYLGTRVRSVIWWLVHRYCCANCMGWSYFVRPLLACLLLAPPGALYGVVCQYRSAEESNFLRSPSGEKMHKHSKYNFAIFREIQMFGIEKYGKN